MRASALDRPVENGSDCSLLIPNDNSALVIQLRRIASFCNKTLGLLNGEVIQSGDLRSEFVDGIGRHHRGKPTAVPGKSQETIEAMRWGALA